MAGMEQLEIHSKDYLIRWVTVKPFYTISWSIQPHRKSIQFGIFKRPNNSPRLNSSHVSLPSSGPQTPSLEPVNGVADDVSEKPTLSLAINKMTSIGMKTVQWYGKCEADKVTSGKYEVPGQEGGTYALVFDNTFSKQVSKTATFVLVVYPTAYPPLLNTQTSNPQTASISIPNSQAPQPKPSPALAPVRNSADSLSRTISRQSAPTTNGANIPRNSDSSGRPSSIFSGVLSKRRRKRHQGYARRFFSLDYTSSTLSYYHNRNSSALRGAIPLSLAAIGANTGTREISIDSGAEIWHLRAANQADFEAWTTALERATKIMLDSRSPADLKLDTQNIMPRAGDAVDDAEWVQVEALVGRVSGIRDAVRRLTQSAHVKMGSSVSIMTDNTSDFGLDEEQKVDERKSFWKRKPSTTNNPQASFFRRSVSAQSALSVSPSDSPVLRVSRSKSQLRPLPEIAQPPGQVVTDDDIQNHCKEVLHDLDRVVADFSEVVSRHKQRRLPIPTPKSAESRLSMQSLDSQEFFDAEDGGTSAFLTIREDSDVEDEESSEDELGSSSEIEDEDEYTFGKQIRVDNISSIFPSRPKSLNPLPCKPAQRRNTVPAPTVMPPSLIGFLRKNVGKDLSSISMPVSANEPLSFLQRAAEQMEYSSLLDQAAAATDGVERLIYTAAFAISNLSNSRVKERAIRKPFNPMLGETYELVREDKGFRFIAEKVSHKPLQLACQAESADWSLMQSPLPSQKFWGKSSEIVTDGKVRLRLHSVGECLSWTAATCFLRNIIAGEKYVEPVGTMTIVNETTGQKVVVTFKAKGMFSGRSEEVTAQAFDAHGEELPLGLQGTWTAALNLTKDGHQTDKPIWKAGPLVANAPKHYGMTQFAAELNEVTDIENGKIPPTDTRLRPDQRVLEEGDPDTAELLKVQLEERQRTRRKEMEEKGEVWTPKWFVPIQIGDEETAWKLKTGKESYWEERGKGTWAGVTNVLQISEAAGVNFKHQNR